MGHGGVDAALYTNFIQALQKCVTVHHPASELRACRMPGSGYALQLDD